ncbi:MAG: thiamine-phosphate kinase [Synechococcaceae cyanobacterium]|nr:thiamine-phosphate kinase [Synechococcaceae cyanobacterium]
MAEPDPPPTAETLADLGEWELIRRLGRFAPAGQFADDAALLPHADTAGAPLVINTDVLVEGLHFSDATTAAEDVGWRAAAANLSDLAAMGCEEALGLTVGLVAPSRTSWAWVEGVYRGLAAALAEHGGLLLGGDCSAGAQRLLAITAVGRLPRACPDSAAGGTRNAPAAAESGEGQAGAFAAIRRGDGRPGDWLVCSGPHGLSRLGLALLQGELELGPNPTALALAERAIRAHRRPQPRFDAVRVLRCCRPESLDWRVGGCDSSDGLQAAVEAIAATSGCRAELEPDGLPLDPSMAGLPQARDWCLAGGEDFELVLALEPAWAEALLARLPGSQRLGALRERDGAAVLRWSDGEPMPSQGAGFQHFH